MALAKEEMRIGNWVEDTKNEGKVKVTAGSLVLLEEGKKEFAGITLNTDYLLQCGFQIDNQSSAEGNSVTYTRNELEITGVRKDPQLVIAADFSVTINNRRVPVEYLHQLQNLYWVLFGEELNVEL
jgi:hypothetical protein